VGSFGAEEHWRYLGVVQNGDGEIEGMLEAVEAEVREEAAVLGRKRISLADMAYLSSTVIRGTLQIEVLACECEANRQDIIESAGRCGKEGRIDCGGAQSTVWRVCMGCGWKKWSGEVNIERIKVVLQGWQEENTMHIYGSVIRGAVHQLQQTRGEGLGW
jgi:hypothetical protein